MAQYIDKDALVAEIEKRWRSLANKNVKANGKYDSEISTLLSIKYFINALEVKEVDLEKSARHYLLYEHLSPLNNILHQVDLKIELQYHKDIEAAFKAGFELGLKSQKGE